MGVRVFVPDDMLSIALGADAVADAFTAQGADVIRNGSRGMCWAEVLVEVDRNGVRHAYANANVDDVADILAGKETVDYLGPTVSIPWLHEQERVIFNRCGVIEPCNVDEYRAHRGYVGLQKALQATPDEIIAEVKTSGLRGRGGAAFPAHIKWRTVADTPSDTKYIVCNADEGDSGTFADRLIMEGDPYRLIEGMTIAGIATGATHGIIYLRSEYPFAKAKLETAIKNARESGWLGENIQGTHHSFDLKVFVGAGSYVCGEETALLESLEGKRGQVRNKPPLPAIEGLFGKPTLIQNVITLCAVPDILDRGGQWHADLGAGASTGTMPFQLAGNVQRGGLVEMPFGTPLIRLIEEFGGGTRNGGPVKTVQVGGPLGAYLPQDQFDLPCTYEDFARVGAGIGHGGIVLFGQDANMRAQAQYAFEFCAEESCGKCTPCRLGAKRGAEMIASESFNSQDLRDLCEVMVDGSACAMGSMTPIPVLSALSNFRDEFPHQTATKQEDAA